MAKFNILTSLLTQLMSNQVDSSWHKRGTEQCFNNGTKSNKLINVTLSTTVDRSVTQLLEQTPYKWAMTSEIDDTNRIQKPRTLVSYLINLLIIYNVNDFGFILDYLI